MKHLICLMLIAGAMAACKNNERDKDSVRIAKEVNRDKADSGTNMQLNDDKNDDMAGTPIAVQKREADFAVEAANGSMIEIQLAALAKNKAANERVKNFATMMMDDHTKMNQDLQRIATAKNITLPQALSDEAKNDIDRLNKKDRTDFDRTYMQMMVNDHKQDIAAFEKAAKDCKDPALKSYIKETLPVLRKHLDSARAIDKTFVTGSTEVPPAYH